MKRILGILSILSVFAAFEAGASTTVLSCNNGDADTIGDQYFQVDLFEDGIGFMPYEGQFTVDAGDMTFSEGTFSIVNKTVTASSEGEESSTIINALLILDEKNNTLNVAISRDRGAFHTYEMTCTAQQEN